MLTFTRPTLPGSVTIRSYSMKLTCGGSTSVTRLPGTTSPAITPYGCSNGTRGSYQIQANIDASGVSAWSNAVIVA